MEEGILKSLNVNDVNGNIEFKNFNKNNKNNIYNNSLGNKIEGLNK